MDGTRGMDVRLHKRNCTEQVDDGYLQWLLNNFTEVIYDVHSLLNDLRCCSMSRDLKWGKKIHVKLVESRHDSNMHVLTALTRMYAKCGSMMDARCVFDSIQKPDVVCWNTLLLGYAENGNGIETLELFSRMKAGEYALNCVTYVAALKACTTLSARQHGAGQVECLKRGREVHSEIGRHINIFVQSTLIDMYGKCGSMVEARHVFENIENPNVVCWNALLSGYTDSGNGEVTLDLFQKMKACECAPNCVTYAAALKACISLTDKRDGDGYNERLTRVREVHSEIGHHLDIYVQSTLINMYGNCGSMVEARQVFESILKPNVVCWNALLLGYAENGGELTTMNLFLKMKACGFAPNNVTHIVALKACTSLAGKLDQSECLRWGSAIHSEIGCEMDISVRNTLIDMYAKCGSMVQARIVFDSLPNPDVVSWTALLMGYAESGNGMDTLELFSKMKACGCMPDSVTYVAALKACTSLAGNGECLKRGREIHSEIGSDLNFQVQSSLIDMYGKCGSMLDAHRVFDSIKHPNVFAWTALLMGYVQKGDSFTTLDLISRMKASGIKPDSVAYIAALRACSLIGALDLGRMFHSEVSVFSACLVTCLIEFYGKCGSMVEAYQVFDSHSIVRVVPTWNALLAGYGSSGDTASVFNTFEAMQFQQFQPDVITFVCILSCCSHAGLVEKARNYFGAMHKQYGITPTLMHYTCMVDVLGRANQLNEAIGVLQKMPCTPDTVTWMTLLSACHKWKNVEIGKYAFQSLMEVDDKCSFGYVLMGQIYGSWGMLEEQERVLKMRTKLGAWKLPEQTFLVDDVGNMVKFVVGEEATKLEELRQEMKGTKPCS